MPQGEQRVKDILSTNQFINECTEEDELFTDTFIICLKLHSNY